MAEYLGLVELGTLYFQGIAKPRPIKPWTKYNGYDEAGDIHQYNYSSPSANGLADWTMGDTDQNDANKLTWHKIRNGKETLLICDRVVLVSCQWYDLRDLGYLTGKAVRIDGRRYELRCLNGGGSARTQPNQDFHSWNGGVAPNEWDNYICNELNIAGLPSLGEKDGDNRLEVADKNTPHNKFWNWAYVGSFCSNGSTSGDPVIRGCNSAKYWETHSTASDSWGWRPVLRVINVPPAITGTDTDLGMLSDQITYPYTITDPDNDVVTIVESVNGKVLRTHTPTLGQEQTLTIDGMNWIKLLNGSHTVTIQATDTAGASVTRTLTFTKSVTTLSAEMGAEHIFAFADRPRRMVVDIIRKLPHGAAMTVEVCNNALDESPAWEDATTSVLRGYAHLFENSNKTAEQWGVNVRVHVDRNNTDGECWIGGIGGKIE